MQTHKHLIKQKSKWTFFTLILAIMVTGTLLSACSQAAAAPQTKDQDPVLNQAAYLSEMVDAARLMTLLLDGTTAEAREALETILSAGDTRFTAVLIELLRASQIGLTTGTGYQESIQALESLSRQTFGGDWPAWVTWYGMTDLLPPPGFTGWKGRLLRQIDPGFEAFLYADAPANIRVEEIQWGGVHVDGIPALDNADMIPADSSQLPGT